MGTATTPPRTGDQRMDALARANEIRTYRAQVKQDLKAGRRHIEDVLDDPMCETMKVLEALMAMPKLGRVKAMKVLDRSRISPSKTVAGLSERQRGEVLARVQRPISV